MLKKYIKSTLESFLGSKSPWVGEQVGASPSKAIVVPVQLGNTFQSYTAPSNGWLYLRATGDLSFAEIQYGEGGTGKMAALSSSQNSGIGLYVKKGQSCMYAIQTLPGGALSNYGGIFYPSV